MAKFWLGIDVGTTAVKAAAYSESGAQEAYGECAVDVSQPSEGHSEQDMHAVWQGVCKVLKDVCGQIDPGSIESIGLAAQGDGLWMLDADQRPNGPAMLWNDTRAGDRVMSQASTVAAHSVGRACHTANWPGTSGSLYGWLQHNDPARAAAAKHIIYCADWIGLKLTGCLASDYSDASIPFFDFGERAWSQPVADALECGDITSKLTPPQRADQKLGFITKDASDETGLPEGIPVSTGTLDLSAMLVGMGMKNAGEIMMILGTTAVVNILTDAVEATDEPVGASVLHSTADTIIRVLAPTTGAANFDWFTGLHPLSLGGESAGEVADKLNALAIDVPPGSNGVLFLPYLNGERAPFVAPQARGSFHGLGSKTTKADMGRAVMEGAAFSLRHCLEAENVALETPVRLTGGGARNTLWCQIVADVMGVDVLVSPASDHGLWGAACLGAAANGKGDACMLARREEQPKRYAPNTQNHDIYRSIFKKYLAVSEASAAIWNAMNTQD